MSEPSNPFKNPRKKGDDASSPPTNEPVDEKVNQWQPPFTNIEDTFDLAENPVSYFYHHINETKPHEEVAWALNWLIKIGSQSLSKEEAFSLGSFCSQDLSSSVISTLWELLNDGDFSRGYGRSHLRPIYQGLGDIGTDECYYILLGDLLSDQINRYADVSLQYTIVASLLQIKENEALEMLISLLDCDYPSLYKPDVMKCIMSSREIINLHLGYDCWLRHFELRSPGLENEVVEVAAQLLGYSGDKRAIPPLLKALEGYQYRWENSMEAVAGFSPDMPLQWIEWSAISALEELGYEGPFPSIVSRQIDREQQS